MIPFVEVSSAAANNKVPAETIEKDYIISWILCCLSKSEIKENFIFYGGTAIKRMYFSEHRYSEDIDLLSHTKYSPEKLLEQLNCLEYAKQQANISIELDVNNILTDKSRLQLFLHYNAFDEIYWAPKQIRLDFVMNMDSFGDTQQVKIIESYSDLLGQNKYLNVMDLNTILANKLGMLLDITRNEPRDIFDIWFLLKRKDKFAFDFERMCQIFKTRYSFRPSHNVLISRLQSSQLEKNWQIRLANQIADLPNVDDIRDEISQMLTNIYGSNSLDNQ